MCGCGLVTFIGSFFLSRYDGRILSERAAALARAAAAPVATGLI
jgi:hypothetical protein